MTPTTQPSPGAVRAAKAIANSNYFAHETEECARIIDAETHTAALLEGGVRICPKLPLCKTKYRLLNKRGAMDVSVPLHRQDVRPATVGHGGATLAALVMLPNSHSKILTAEAGYPHPSRQI